MQIREYVQTDQGPATCSIQMPDTPEVRELVAYFERNGSKLPADTPPNGVSVIVGESTYWSGYCKNMLVLCRAAERKQAQAIRAKCLPGQILLPLARYLDADEMIPACDDILRDRKRLQDRGERDWIIYQLRQILMIIFLVCRDELSRRIKRLLFRFRR